MEVGACEAGGALTCIRVQCNLDSPESGTHMDSNVLTIYLLWGAGG